MLGSQESVATQKEKTMCDHVACLLGRCKNVGDAVGQRCPLMLSALMLNQAGFIQMFILITTRLHKVSLSH